MSAADRCAPARFRASRCFPSGTVVAIWTRPGRRGSTLVRVVSRDGGRTWSRPRVVLRRRGLAFTPGLAAAPDGTLGLSWTETARDRAAIAR